MGGGTNRTGAQGRKESSGKLRNIWPNEGSNVSTMFVIPVIGGVWPFILAFSATSRMTIRSDRSLRNAADQISIRSWWE
jgi:hypothetical protein